jgi:hypothetical protein
VGDTRRTLQSRIFGPRCSLAAVHAGSPLPSRFDAFAIVDAYHATAVARDAPVPERFGGLIAGAHEIRAATRTAWSSARSPVGSA